MALFAPSNRASFPSSQLLASSRAISLCVILLILLSVNSFAADKRWTGSGDGASWTDDENWTPAVTPTAADEVKVNKSGAQVELDQSFEARSLSVGANQSSQVVVQDFTSGTLAPGSPDEDAVLNQRVGTVTLRGSAGTVTLKGRYKDSEEVVVDEPSFVLYVR